MKNLQPQLQESINYIKYLIDKNGPEIYDYQKLDYTLQIIGQSIEEESIPSDYLNQIRNYFGVAFSKETMQGFAYTKPHGYAGDYEIIERIYDWYLSTDERCAKWDIYWQNHQAARAVRNRVKYFQKSLTNTLNDLNRITNGKKKINILNLASGPSRIIFNFLANNEHLASSVHIDCVELDENAIAFSKTRTAKYANSLNYIHKNVFKFLPEKNYDVIWSSGLFDYFDDKVFIKLLSRFYDYLNPGGRIIIGNFSPKTMSRHYMELFDWKLFYRSESQLINLGKKFANKNDILYVEAEEENANLFLNIIKSKM